MEPLQYDSDGRVILPEPNEISAKDREHAAGSYIMMFVSQYLPLPLANLVAAFIYYMFCRKRNRFVAFHAYQSFVSQIPTSVALWALVVWTIYAIFAVGLDNWASVFTIQYWVVVGVVVIWNIVYTILSIIAYLRAGKGELYYLPLFGNHTFYRYFGPNAVQMDAPDRTAAVNRPPKGVQ